LGLGARGQESQNPRPFLCTIGLVPILPLLAVLVQTLTGASVDPLQAPAGTKAIVFLFTSTDCPISNRYAPEVRRLAEAYGSKGVVFRLIYPNPAETPAAIREHMSAFRYAGATDALRDPEHALVKLAGATVTPEAAVYASGRLAYRGRIDNRYVELGVERPAATQRDLADALAAVVAGKAVTSPTTQAVGCFIADFAR
jgi:thiol-disulfide isomerase/thioredoxin